MARSLPEAIESDKGAIVDCWRSRVQGGLEPAAAPPSEIIDTLPAFLDELIVRLRDAASRGARSSHSEKAGEIATEHGSQRFHAGFSLGAVIREYGVLRDCLLDFIHERGIAVSPAELRTVFALLTSSVANAAEQYAHERDRAIERQSEQHFGFIAHELRNPLTSAMLAAHALQRRAGSAGDVVVQRLIRNLSTLRHRIDNSLVSVRIRDLARSRTVDVADVSLREMVNDVATELAGDAEERDISIVIDGEAATRADPRLIHSAITNLISNAVKYTQRSGRVRARIRQTEELASVEIEDECGGLPEGKAEELFMPFVQRGSDRSGFGLGLAITKDAVEAHRGTVQVSNLPGKGCVFMISLPRGDVR